MNKTVDLSQDYGVVYGSFGSSPYTPQQYLQAETNRLGIQQAINDAANEGVTDLIFTHFDVITLGYKYSDNSNLAGRGESLITLKSNMEYDFSNSKLEMMFDSVNKSPYHTSTSRPNAYQLNGKVIDTTNCKNFTVYNLEIQGDVYKRSWANINEKSEEQTYGVMFGVSSYIGNFVGCKIHGFMGDSVRGPLGKDGIKIISTGFLDFQKGLYNTTTGVIDTTIPGAYVSDIKDLNLTNINLNVNFNNTLVQLRIVAGSNAVLRFSSELNELVWLNADNVVVGITSVFSSDSVAIPTGATKVMLQLFNVNSTDPTYQYGVPLYPPTLVMAVSRGLELHSCEFSNNHRGGLSNLPDDFVVQNCSFWTNGLDSGIGAPQFPDTTRYQIDIEDSFTSGGKIRDNRFNNSFNGVLCSAYNVDITGNIFNNSGGIGLYGRCLNANVVNNKIYGGTNGIFIQPFNNTDLTTGARRRIFIENNIVVNDDTSFTILAANLESTDVWITNNSFNSPRFYLEGKLGSYLNFSNNKITIKKNIKSASTFLTGSLIKDVPIFNNNEIINPISGNALIAPRLYVMGSVLGEGNVVSNFTIFKYGFSTIPDLNFDLNINGITFNNCLYQSGVYNVGSMLHAYTDCVFNGESPFISQNTLDNSVHTYTYNKCCFNINTDKILNASNTLNYSGNKNYIINLNDCSAVSAQNNDIYVLKVLSPNSNISRRVRFNIKDLGTKGNGFVGIENRILQGSNEL